jgi:DegV family protein with EDD domain
MDHPIRIVTDSTASLPRKLVESLGIVEVPISIQFGRDTYREGVDIDPETFYRRLELELPTTSQPPPADFIHAYRGLVERVRTIISIHVTGKASGTVQSAHLARQTFPDSDIEVVDSGFTSMALGFMVLEAARAALAGASKDEVMRVITDARERISPYIAIPTLSFLRRSGRVGAGAAVVGSMLSIKPILTMRDGLVEAIERVRTYPRALARVAELTEEAARGRRVRLAVIYSRAQEEARRFCQDLQRRLHVVDEPIVTEMGAALAVHGGPGMIGAVTYRVG